MNRADCDAIHTDIEWGCDRCKAERMDRKYAELMRRCLAAEDRARELLGDLEKRRLEWMGWAVGARDSARRVYVAALGILGLIDDGAARGESWGYARAELAEAVAAFEAETP